MTQRPDKLDQILAELHEIKDVQRVQADVLTDHTRRSTASEGRLDILEAFVTQVLTYMRGVKWFGIALAGIVGALAAVATILATVHAW